MRPDTSELIKIIMNIKDWAFINFRYILYRDRHSFYVQYMAEHVRRGWRWDKEENTQGVVQAPQLDGVY